MTQEAAGIDRQLAQARPAAFLPGLAMALNNLASRLAGWGGGRRPWRRPSEAVTIRRQLAQASPAAYLPDLATSLNNLASSWLSGVGGRRPRPRPRRPQASAASSPRPAPTRSCRASPCR